MWSKLIPLVLFFIWSKHFPHNTIKNLYHPHQPIIGNSFQNLYHPRQPLSEAHGAWGPGNCPIAPSMNWQLRNCIALHCFALSLYELTFSKLQCNAMQCTAFPNCNAMLFKTMQCFSRQCNAMSVQNCNALHFKAMHIAHCPTELHCTYYTLSDFTFMHWAIQCILRHCTFSIETASS